MYVKWKVLFGFATTFWISLCLYDNYFINPETKTFYYSEDDISKWEKEKLDYDKSKSAESSFSFGVSLILWNIFTFFSTVFVCSTVKFSMSFLDRIKNSLQIRKQLFAPSKHDATTNADTLSNNEVEIKKSSTCSKIPLYVNSKTSLHSANDANDEKDKEMINSCISLLSNSSSSFDVGIRQSRVSSEMSSQLEKQIERRCAQLREEMLVQQSKSLKEHATLSRRLEVVSREKRDLQRQLMLVQKENRSAKQQLDDIIVEKELLVKRLDCASKEFKVNTNSKKVALAKLDEAHATISEMKAQLELTGKEKEALEKKIKMLDYEHKLVKNRLFNAQKDEKQDSVDKHQSSEPISLHGVEPEASQLTTKSAPPQSCLNDDKTSKQQVILKEVKKLNLSEITQSQQDVEKVQLRLINLEKSLNKLKLANLTKNEDHEKRNVEKYETAFHSDAISTENETTKSSNESPVPELPIEEFKQKAVEILTSRNDNLTDEQRRKILGPIESSGDELLRHDFDNLLDYTIEDPFERVGTVINSSKSSGYATRGKLIARDLETTSTNDDYDTDGYRRLSKRIVSNSPAFQKFLRKMDHTEYRRKVPPLTQAF